MRALVRWPLLAYKTWRGARPSPCRYHPSCSTYALEAIDVHGPVHGSWLAVRRFVRCAPWGSWGFDPVPEKSEPITNSWGAR